MPCELPTSFSAQAETGNETSQLTLAAVAKSREGRNIRAQKGEVRQGRTGFWGGEGWVCGQGDLAVFALDSHFVVLIIPGGGRKISPNNAPSDDKVWAEAEGLVRCPRLTHHSTDHVLVPFRTRADALLS